MTRALTDLILELSIYVPIGSVPQPKALEFIRDYERFISALQNIDQLVGLEKVKIQVASQVKFFIANYRRSGSPTNGEQLHTLIYGPPGCGKTQLGKHLAELWTVSGCLNPKNTEPISPNSSAVTQSNMVPLLPSLANFTRGLNGISDRLIKEKTLEIEKDQLRTDLNLREAQIRRYQELFGEVSSTLKLCLAGFNNTRKKLRASKPEQEGKIQAKLQQLKKNLTTIYSKIPEPVEYLNNPTLTNQVLPVAVPNFPGTRAVFGSSDSPVNNELSPTRIGQSLSQINLVQNNYNPTKYPTPTQNLNKPVVESKKVPPSKFVVVTRGDLIAKFQGHTTDKLRQLFDQYDGGVIFVDEAYSLVNSGTDDFGKEILTEINNYMSAHPDRVIFIFAGYRADMEQVVMKVQPGLDRRFKWTFEIKDYTAEQLFEIFRSQLRKDDWDLREDQLAQFSKFFEKHVQNFPHYGGDTEKLCAFVKEAFYSLHWKKALDDIYSDSEYQKIFNNLSYELIEESFQNFLNNSSSHLGKAHSEKEMLKLASIYN